MTRYRGIRRRSAVVVAFVLAACGSTPALTGLGAEPSAWHAHHGAGYTDVLIGSDDRVSGFTVTMSPRSLAAAETLVRRDLPPDATTAPAVLGEGVEGTKCEIVEFTSATLLKTLGSDQVMAVFSTAAAVTMDTTKINHVVVVSATEHYPRAC